MYFINTEREIISKLMDGYRYIGENASIFDIIILDDEMTSNIEKIERDEDEESVTINDKEYLLSPEINKLNNMGKKSKIRLGCQYRFIMDSNNKIIDVEFCDGEVYGFFCKYSYIEDEEIYVLNFFDLDSSEMSKKTLARKVTLNGKKVSCGDVVKAFRTDSNGILQEDVVPQLFIYRKNSDGEINYIDTWIYNKGIEDPNTSLRLSVKGTDFAIKSAKYSLSHRFFMADDTRVLTVRTKKQNGVEKLVNESSSFSVSNREISDYWASYNVEAYNCNAAGTTNMVVLYKSVDYDMDTETEIDGGMMYSSISEILYDDEACKQLNGYTPNGPVSIVLDKDLIVKDWNGSSFVKIDTSKLQKGDIIKYEMNESKCMKIERIFSYNNSKDFYNEYHYYRSFMGIGQSHFSYGKAFAYENGVMRVKFDTDFNLDNQNSYAVIETGDKDVLIYDTDKEAFEIIRPDGVLCADNTNDFNTAYDIVFHTHDMRLSSIYAYK